MGGISLPQLLIIGVIVVLLFGTKRLRHLGSDLGSAIKGFKKALNEEDEKKEDLPSITRQDADFDVKPPGDNSAMKTQDTTSKNKEQD